MSKSYSPLNPKQLKRKPGWVGRREAVELTELHTDDTEFGRGFLDRDFSPRFARYAEKRGGRWSVVEIDKTRITRTVPMQGLLYEI